MLPSLHMSQVGIGAMEGWARTPLSGLMSLGRMAKNMLAAMPLKMDR